MMAPAVLSRVARHLGRSEKKRNELTVVCGRLAAPESPRGGSEIWQTLVPLQAKTLELGEGLVLHA
jgi:hypothetical protein